MRSSSRRLTPTLIRSDGSAIPGDDAGGDRTSMGPMRTIRRRPGSTLVGHGGAGGIITGDDDMGSGLRSPEPCQQLAPALTVGAAAVINPNFFCFSTIVKEGPVSLGHDRT